MKSLLFVLVLLAIDLNAQPIEMSQVRAVLDQQVSDWNNGDIPSFMKGYWNNDSLRFIGKRGITYGWQPVLDNYLKSYPNKSAIGVLEFKELNIDILAKDAAFVTGNWTIKYVDKDNAGGWFSLLFRKIEGKWVIVVDHTS
jgi:hypothetical protein